MQCGITKKAEQARVYNPTSFRFTRLFYKTCNYIQLQNVFKIELESTSCTLHRALKIN